MNGKMKRLLTVLSLILCLSILLALFSACGDSKKSASSAEEETETVEKKKKKDSEEEDETTEEKKKNEKNDTEDDDEDGDPFIGSWTGFVSINENMTSALSDLFDFSTASEKKDFNDASMRIFEDYAIEFSLDFKSTGKFKIESSYAPLEKKLKNNLEEDLYELFEYALGDDYEDVDELLEDGGFESMEAFIEAAGLNAENILDGIEDSMADESGYYKIENGELFFAQTKAALDDAANTEYKLKGDQLTLRFLGSEIVFEKD